MEVRSRPCLTANVDGQPTGFFRFTIHQKASPMRLSTSLSDRKLNLSRRSPASRRRGSPRRAMALVARVESLEARTLLSAVTWTGLAGTMSWNDAANWSGNALPGSDDD